MLNFRSHVNNPELYGIMFTDFNHCELTNGSKYNTIKANNIKLLNLTAVLTFLWVTTSQVMFNCYLAKVCFSDKISIVKNMLLSRN